MNRAPISDAIRRLQSLVGPCSEPAATLRRRTCRLCFRLRLCIAGHRCQRPAATTAGTKCGTGSVCERARVPGGDGLGGEGRNPAGVSARAAAVRVGRGRRCRRTNSPSSIRPVGPPETQQSAPCNSPSKNCPSSTRPSGSERRPVPCSWPRSNSLCIDTAWHGSAVSTCARAAQQGRQWVGSVWVATDPLSTRPFGAVRVPAPCSWPCWKLPSSTQPDGTTFFPPYRARGEVVAAERGRERERNSEE